MWSLLLILGAVLLQLYVTVEAASAFNCRSSLISDEWRQMVLDFVNKKRTRLASGGQVDKKGIALPYATDMNKLNWDCNLEQIAFEEIANGCADSKQATYAKTQAPFKSNAKCEITATTKQILNGWWNEVRNVDMNKNSQYVASSEDFAQMANAATKAFACTYNSCGSKGTMLCLYDQKAATNPAGPLYTTNADKAKICDTCAKTCVESLCPQTTTPVEIPPPCANDKLTPDGNKAAIWMHNYYRRLLATGWAKDGKGYAPPAKKMLELTYDCTGAAAGVAAKTYAAIEGCPTTDPQPMGGYSMNFRRLNDYTLSDKDALVQAITDWWSPLKNADLDTNLEFTDGSPLTSFANMAYEVTSKFACSVKNCPNIGKTLVMCQYNPPITDGEKIYEPGKVCSGCRNLGKKCSDPQGLCV
ncbi:hypothetical protein Aduo_019471 [Ancylostoma duodenale]